MMKYMKKYLTVLLIAAIAAGLIPATFTAASSDNFQKQREYDGRFTDVSGSDWFYESVKTGYEYDLINGVSATSFVPKSELSIAEILALASRLHNICVDGQYSFIQGSPWYQVYVDYARENGFLIPGLDSYSRAAKREEVAAILAKALPDDVFTPINTVKDGALPDVSMGAPYASEIYALYRAGILVGNDDKGTFHPNTSIRRSEIATIIARVVNPDLRQDRTFKKLEKLYFAFFEVAANNLTKTSISGVYVRFYGDVTSIDPDDFTDFVLTRDGKRVDNPLILSEDIIHREWSYEEITDFYFKFEREITEPGKYGLTFRYGGTPFTVYEKIIEAPVGNDPADPADLRSVGFSYNANQNDKPEKLTSASFLFSGTQQQFYLSDLTNLKLTRNGSVIEFSFRQDVVRYLEVEDAGVGTLFYVDFSNGGFTTPGTYILTGAYKGVAFTSLEITIPSTP